MAVNARKLALDVLLRCEKDTGYSNLALDAALTREELTAKVDSLSVQLVNTNKELDGFMGLFNEVTEGFRLINEAENRIEVQSGDVENGINGIREKVKYDLAFIQNKMNENRELIAELEN